MVLRLIRIRSPATLHFSDDFPQWWEVYVHTALTKTVWLRAFERLELGGLSSHMSYFLRWP